MPANDPTGLRFGEAAAAYERGRPSYPPSIVEWLLDGRPERVVDLGAGTGKLTRLLTPRADLVIAVEPDPGMRAALGTALPQVPALAGTGEHIPLPGSSIDVVVAGQAWHWVDPQRGSAEVARVLRPTGWLGLVWNDRDEDNAWVRELTRLMSEYGTMPDADYEPTVGEPFAPGLERTEVAWTHDVTLDDAVDMVASRSYVIALDDAARADLLGRVRAHAAASMVGDRVPVPYVTRAFRARLDGGARSRW